MRAAAVQFRGDRSQLDDSRERLVGLAREAAAHADLVVLPEMAATGYVFEDRAEAESVAEAADGPTARALAAVAREGSAWVVAGFPERARGRLYNSAMVIDPAGELAFVYRKTLLFDIDLHWADPGRTGYRRFRTAFGSFGVGICMDLNDPRFVEWLRRTPIDALAFPTNWIDEGTDVWPYWEARLAGLGTVLVAANTYGVERGVPFAGRSVILDGDRVLASGPREGDVVLHAAW